MPLMSLDGPAEYRGGEVEFAMRSFDDPDGTTRVVTVTLGAIEGLASADMTGRQMVEWVDRHRSQFEQIASAKHDQGQTLRLTVNDWIARFPMPGE